MIIIQLCIFNGRFVSINP